MKRLLPFVLLLAACSGSQEQSPEPQWHVVDTDFSKGRLGNEQTVTFTDLEKLHGHWCDGLVVGALGLGEALKEFYPSAPIDRTDLRVISRSSPCLTDVAIMLTGGRAQFGTFQVSDTIPGLYIVQRISDGRTYIVKLRPGVKPALIDSLGRLAVARTLSPCGLDSLQAIEASFGADLLAQDPKSTFDVKELTAFQWPEPAFVTYTKTDILNKNAPRCAH
ncbi:MAG: formylmethanofuran dehydrogenase subunit E family protein [Flavobacteriales bacterium]|nr:formylmethanofuran dehydrogenase subunit E family protein [Flavobacteriales bacterium]